MKNFNIVANTNHGVSAYATLISFVLFICFLESSAQSSSKAPSQQIITNKDAAIELAHTHIKQGLKNSRQVYYFYPYEAGFHTAEEVETNAERSGTIEGNNIAKDINTALKKLPVKRAHPDENRIIDARKATDLEYSAAITILKKLLAAQPSDTALQHDLAAAYAGRANVVWADDVLDQYQKAIAIQKTLVLKQPNNTVWRSELADMYQGLGNTQFNNQGGERSARASKMAELDLREKLAEAEPTNTRYLHELALNYDRLGEMFHTVGPSSQAHDAYKAGFETHQQLAKLDPGNLQWQLDFASNRYNAGEFELSKKRDIGLEMLQEALRMRTAIVERNPSNIRAQTDLRDSWMRIAEESSEYNAGQWEYALPIYQQALAQMQRMAASNTTDPGWLFYQIEFLFHIGFSIEDEIRPRLGTQIPPTSEQQKRVKTESDEVFKQILSTVRNLSTMSSNPETQQIYKTAQGPNLQFH